MNLKAFLPKIKKNVLLKNHTTIKIGGQAKYLFEAKTKEDLILAIKTAKKLKLPFFILGGGSKLLVADQGFKGLIIKVQSSPKESLRFPTGQAKSRTVYAEAGVSLASIVLEAKENSLTGLEWAIGIPGTIGGAVRGNTGAFGKSIGDLVKEVEVFDSKKQEIKTFEKKDCNFGYRESIFKENSNLFVLSVKIRLKKRKKSEMEKEINEYLNYRKKIQPLNFPSSGSIFKNPSPSQVFLKKFGRASGFSAAELIEKCKLKGKKIGNVKISEKHANFIVNLGNGKAKDVKKLINLAKKKVKEKFGVNLKEEIQYLGFKK